MFGLLASSSGEPLLLTVIALLAMLGMFLLFGVAAGHIRVGPRIAAGDLLKAAADAGDEPKVIAHLDGTIVYSNSALEQMFGRHEAGPFAALEAALSPDDEAAQAFFRLTRAAERGEARREDVRLRPGVSRRPSWVRIAVRPFVSSGRDVDDASARQRLVLWQVNDISSDKAREAQRIGGLEASLAAFDAMPAGVV